MKFVRIRPYNKARGQLVRRYVYGGFRLEADHGWYEVDDEIADYLEKVLTFPDDPDSKPVFDVKDKEGAENLAREEYEAANPERKITEAVAGRQKVTVDDLDSVTKAKTKAKAASPKGKKEKPAKEAGEPKAPEASAKTKTAASGESDSKKRSDD